jgi:hypothetical protein
MPLYDDDDDDDNKPVRPTWAMGALFRGATGTKEHLQWIQPILYIPDKPVEALQLLSDFP